MTEINLSFAVERVDPADGLNHCRPGEMVLLEYLRQSGKSALDISSECMEDSKELKFGIYPDW